MNVVILGATRGMGRALARRFAARGDRLFLLGRNARELGRSVADLAVRSPNFAGGVGGDGRAFHARCDLAETSTFAPALRAAASALGRIDVIVVTAGVFGTQDELEADIERCAALLQINFTNTIVFCEHARQTLLELGGGTLCVFSSVAGDRGRTPVVLYGAAKAGLSRYLEGLDHRFRAQGLTTVCVKPGFVHTGMTAGLQPPPFAGEPDEVAVDVLRAIDAGTPVVYTPGIWRLIMLFIMLLPRFVMRRVGF